jgi:hypothetical protein
VVGFPVHANSPMYQDVGSSVQLSEICTAPALAAAGNSTAVASTHVAMPMSLRTSSLLYVGSFCRRSR